MFRGPIKFKIEGLREAQKALRKLPDAVARRVVQKVLRKRLKPIADDMRANAPERFGTLKKSIRVGSRLSRRQKRLHHKVDRHDIEMFAGPGPMPQAIMTEFGSRLQKSQAFVRPAWDRGKRALHDGITGDLWTEIKRQVAKGH